MGKIKVVALDLDGTLTNSSKEISPRTLQALQKAMQQGVIVALASGRPLIGFQYLADELQLKEHGGYMLAYNGAMVRECATGNIIYTKQFPPELIADTCAFFRAHDSAVLCYNSVGVVTESPEDKWVQLEGKICRVPVIKVDDLPDYLNYPIGKLLTTMDPSRIDAIEKEAKAHFAGKADIFRSCEFYLECVAPGVNKAAGLAAVLQRLGLQPENLLAAGDAMNDYEMIRYAGVGVAMANGSAPVKVAADYVTQADNDHDGVAEAIEKFVLTEQ